MYKALCFCGLLIRSIRAVKLMQQLADDLNFEKFDIFIHTVQSI